MLVLDGPQGIGKSRLVWWLGSPLPAFFITNAINTNDKDFLILLCSKWIWEVEELGATLRKSDVESLKAFLSKEIINVRKPYGHDEIVKPATASFIGTINSSGGFLADPTGSRRFRVCTLTSINWDYAKYIDVNQVWAQAVALFKGGETWELNEELQTKMAEINSRYDVDDPIAFDIFETFNVDPEAHDKYTATAQIIHRLRVDGKVVGGDDRQIAQRIANVLVRLGCVKDRVRVNGQLTRVWRGVWLR
jgi:predicted P-loop ATPase